MGLFGFGKKKEWDIARSDANKNKIKALFNMVMPDADSWKLAYGYSLNIKNSNYIIARKTTYEYTSLIVAYRESDMSIALLQTTPEFEGCSDPEIFKADEIKKAKISSGMYTIFHQGGIMAGYTQFGVLEGNDEDFLAYVYQPDEFKDFDEFFAKYSKR